ncbi:MAG TPA: YceD family protein [Dermatophilaceae bacterium]|nr:YceD family protein [Dermatophilaceae bacterium]
MTRLNPAAQLVLDLRDLSRRPGSMIRLHRVAAADAAIGTDVVAIPAGAPLEVDTRAESVVEGVLLTGSVRASATGACVRCLDPLTHEVDAQFQELFAYTDRAAHHHEVGAQDDEDEVRELDGDLLDLEPVLRDAVVPTLPFQPVCRDDCPGLCPDCGARLGDDPDHRHDRVDPRWAALEGLSATGDATS